MGCTDTSACNYSETATDDDGSALPTSFYDCFNGCLNDADGDGVCDELEIIGCTDTTACNYSEIATDDDGNCITNNDSIVAGFGGCDAAISALGCNFIFGGLLFTKYVQPLVTGFIILFRIYSYFMIITTRYCINDSDEMNLQMKLVSGYRFYCI